MILRKIWHKASVLCAIWCIFSLSLSLTTLQYSEAIENDGLTIRKNIDLSLSSSEDSQNTDNDNDNETFQALIDFDFLGKYEFFLPIPSPLTIALPDYKNSYLFAFISILIKPPIWLV
jgi:hypothetical protein